MVSHINYNLSTNEGFVIFSASKLSICFIDSFTLGMKSQETAYILRGIEHTYWILDLEGAVHSIWDLWTSFMPYLGNLSTWQCFLKWRLGTCVKSWVETKSWTQLLTQVP